MTKKDHFKALTACSLSDFKLYKLERRNQMPSAMFNGHKFQETILQ